MHNFFIDNGAVFEYNVQALRKHAGIAQQVEHLTRNEKVACSSHVSSSTKKVSFVYLTKETFSMISAVYHIASAIYHSGVSGQSFLPDRPKANVHYKM